MLLSSSGIKGQQDQCRYAKHRRSYQQKKSFHVRWQQRKDRVDGQEIEVRHRRRMNECRVERPRGTLRPEHQRASHNRDDEEAAEDQILTDHVRNERHAGLFYRLFVLRFRTIPSLTTYPGLGYSLIPFHKTRRR